MPAVHQGRLTAVDCRWHDKFAVVKWTTASLATVPLCEYCYVDWSVRADKVFHACAQESSRTRLMLFPYRLEWTDVTARLKYEKAARRSA